MQRSPCKGSAERERLTFDGFEDVFGFLLESDENVVFHVEADLFDTGDRSQMIPVDHLADEKESVLEDIQLRPLFGRFNIRHDQRVKIEPLAKTN